MVLSFWRAATSLPPSVSLEANRALIERPPEDRSGGTGALHLLQVPNIPDSPRAEDLERRRGADPPQSLQVGTAGRPVVPHGSDQGGASARSFESPDSL